MKRGKTSKAILLGVCAVLLSALFFTGCDGTTNPESTVSKTWYVTLSNRGSASNPAAFKDGDTYTLPTPTRKWYTFKGWNTGKDGLGHLYAAGEVITVSSNLDLYGQWTLNSSTMTMPDSSYDVFCNDRESLDSTDSITIIITNALPDADDLSAPSHNLNITLDLSACTSLKHIDDTFAFKNLVGIVFPEQIESISAGAFSNCWSKLISVEFSKTLIDWYCYPSGSWDKANKRPSSFSVKNIRFSASDYFSNATDFKNYGAAPSTSTIGCYWSTISFSN